MVIAKNGDYLVLTIKSIIMLYLILFLLVFILAVKAALDYSNDENNKAKFSKWENEIFLKYGKPTLKITSDNIVNKDESVFVFDELKKIFIKQTIYDYSDILDFSVNGQMSYKTSTSTGSMIGRGIVGGILLGGVGALAGASTSKKNTSSEVDYYLITINIRNIQRPIVEYKTSKISVANQLAGVLKIIIDSNQNLEH